MSSMSKMDEKTDDKETESCTAVQLPDEVMEKICGLVGRRDLLSLRAADSFWCAAVHDFCLHRIRTAYSADQLEKLGCGHSSESSSQRCGCLELYAGFAPWRCDLATSCVPAVPGGPPGGGDPRAEGLKMYALTASADHVFVFYYKSNRKVRQVSVFSRASSAHLANLECIEDKAYDPDMFEGVPPVVRGNILVFPGRDRSKLTVYSTLSLKKIGDIEDFAAKLRQKTQQQEIVVKDFKIGTDKLVVLASKHNSDEACIFIYNLDPNHPKPLQFTFQSLIYGGSYGVFLEMQLGSNHVVVNVIRSADDYDDNVVLVLVHDLPNKNRDTIKLPRRFRIPLFGGNVLGNRKVCIDDSPTCYKIFHKSGISLTLEESGEHDWTIATVTEDNGWHIRTFHQNVAEDSRIHCVLVEGNTVVRIELDHLGGSKIDKINPPYLEWQPFAKLDWVAEDKHVFFKAIETRADSDDEDEESTVEEADRSKLGEISFVHMDNWGLVVGDQSSFRVYKFVRNFGE